MKRREFIAVVVGAAAAWPLAARAQQAARLWRIGFLAPVPPTRAMLKAFTDSLREHGYIEGQNLSIMVRWPDGSFEHDPGVAADLVAVNPDAIVAWASPSVAAARRATSTIPIVMASVGDSVSVGFVQNLARPGGNVTGVSNVSHDLSSKVVQLIVETAPRIKQIGVVHNPRNPGLLIQLRQTAEAVHALGRQLETVDAGTSEEIDRALQKLKRAGVHGVIFLPDPSLIVYRGNIAEFAVQAGWPTAFQRRENVEPGGLLSYGASLHDQLRQAAFYVDRILKGAKPATCRWSTRARSSWSST